MTSPHACLLSIIVCPQNRFAIRLFLIHLRRNIMGVRSLFRAIRHAAGAEIQFRARRFRVVVDAFFSRAIMELRR